MILSFSDLRDFKDHNKFWKIPNSRLSQWLTVLKITDPLKHQNVRLRTKRKLRQGKKPNRWQTYSHLLESLKSQGHGSLFNKAKGENLVYIVNLH